MDNINKLKVKALTLMEKNGFPIKEDIVVEVDNSLSIMGYTTERQGKTVIVVSGWSLSSDMSLGLIIHELSHVYRIETKHPSHNHALHNKVLYEIFNDIDIYPYQREILNNIINNIQDLYADDISFPVFIKESYPGNINEFFLNWVHKPITPILSEEDIWRNAGSLLNAAFAQANLERHQVEDSNQKIEKAVEKLLKQLPSYQAHKLSFFTDVMVHLPEEVSDVTFEKILKKYINEFLLLVRR